MSDPVAGCRLAGGRADVKSSNLKLWGWGFSWRFMCLWEGLLVRVGRLTIMHQLCQRAPHYRYGCVSRLPPVSFDRYGDSRGGGY